MAARLAVNPTRMELLKVRSRLVTARRGHKLLKDKLEGLMREFVSLAGEYRKCRLQVDEGLPEVLKLFVLAEITSSRRIVEGALESIRQDLRLNVTRKRLMSVQVPRIEAAFGETSGMYSLIHTPPELDKAVDSLKDFMPVLLKTAELEQGIRIVISEIERTRRRVNALEHTFIPRMVETVRFIAAKLDEMERSNTARLMMVKARSLAEESEQQGHL